MEKDLKAAARKFIENLDIEDLKKWFKQIPGDPIEFKYPEETIPTIVTVILLDFVREVM